jgi:hypothetical protein
MLPDHDQQPGNFPATRWSLVARVGAPNQDGHEALSELLRSYLPALRAHLVYRKRLPPDEAEDLLQEFVAHKVLQKNLLAQADRELGKFRTFLLTALDRFLANWRRDRHAGKRAPEGGMVNIDDELECAGREARPSDVFDVTWARQVIDEALRRMREECEASGRLDVWGVFEYRIVGPLLQGTPPSDYRHLVERFGLTSPTQATNLLVTAKRMYARALRSAIAQYARDESEIDAELADLQAILARCGRGAA